MFCCLDSWTITNGSGVLASFGDTNTVCYAFTQPGTYTIEHILVSDCGTDTATHTIYVHGIIFDLPDTLVCSSADSVTLDAGSGYDSYLWSNGATTQTITAGNGTYWVELGQQIGSSLCTAVDTIRVNLSDLSVTLNDTTACAGGLILLQPIVSGGVPNYSYNWNTGQTNISINVSTAGNYWVTVTDALGCQATDSMVLNLIYPLPGDFDFEDTICVMDTACFVALPINGVHEWNIYNANGNVVASFGDTSQICFLFAVEGNYTIEHIVSNECFTETIREIITVIPPIQACIEMIGTNPFCAGDSVGLTIHDPLDQVTGIDWYLNGNYIGSADTLWATQPGTYTAMVQDANGCTSACMCVVLTQLPNPQVNLPATAYVCGGGDTETLHPLGTFSSFVWYNGNTIVGTGSSLTVSTPGTYRVEATSANGCTSTDSTVVELRTIDVTLGTATAAACVGEDVTLTTPFNTAYTYQWQYFQAGSWHSLSGSGNQITTPVYKLGNNSFRVIVTDQLTGCQDIATVNVQGIVGPCNSFILSPNPTVNERSTVYYSLDGRGIQQATIEVLSMQGQLMKTYTLNIEETSKEIEFFGYSEGVYILRMICDGEVMYTDRIAVLR